MTFTEKLIMLVNAYNQAPKETKNPNEENEKFMKELYESLRYWNYLK